MSFISELYQSFTKNKNKQAFCINGQYISFAEFLEYINGTRALLEDTLEGVNNPVGIISYECIETYAAIFATWFSGNYYVPLNPKHPAVRNVSSIKKVGIQYVLSPGKDLQDLSDSTENLHIIVNKDIKSKESKKPIKVLKGQKMYILSTSGSTGSPKYVPITMENLASYCNAFTERFPELMSDACFLQIYDHTFDASFTSYLIPLMLGACVYTLPDNQFKFLSIAKILADKNVNWVKLTPSVLSFLTPYKSKLDFKHLKTIIFGGEALPVSLLKEWYPVFPEAQIANHYGPTETTVGVTSYKIKDIQHIRSMNGIVSIGKPFKGVECIIIDEKGEEVATGEKGELCIGGKQVMQGYLYSEDSPFIDREINNERKRFYRSGDMVQKDKDGYIYFLGRTDDQVKIAGFRVDLQEVENAVREAVKNDGGIAAVAIERKPGINQLVVFIENYSGDGHEITSILASQIQSYKIPDQIIGVQHFPLNTSGKTDKKALVAQYYKPKNEY